MAETLTLSRPWAELSRTAEQLKLRARALWLAHPRETIGIGLLGFVAAGALGTALAPTNSVQAAPPAPPPLLLKQVAPQQALQINAAIPIESGPNPAASPFVFSGNAAARNQALTCLASAVYYEAGNQDADGQRAVAQVVLNRVRHPAFPSSVCGVVYEGSTRATGCQFTFTCDGSLYRQPDAEGWKQAYNVAKAALAGAVYAPVGWATHYHADYVVPYWSTTLAKSAVVGAHIFYRWAGGWGLPGAFTSSYSGHEPNAATLRTAALSVPHNVTSPSSLAAKIDQIPGAEVIKLAPSMRGDKRIAVRFNLTARKASDEAVHEDYVQKFEASDNLKFALSSETTSANEKPLGKSADTVQQTAAAGSAAARP